MKKTRTHKAYAQNIAHWFVRYIFLVGLVLSGISLALSFTPNINPMLGSLFINFSSDFFMIGLTIQVVNRLIKRSEQQKMGEIPNIAKEAIDNELRKLIVVLYFSLKGVSKSSEKSTDTNQIKTPRPEIKGIIEQMDILAISQLKIIDPLKLTYEMFAKMLELIRQTLGELDILIERYNIILEPEDVSRALELRREIEVVSNAHGLITLSVPFFARQTPKKYLNKQQRAACMSIKNDIIELTENYFRIAS